MLFRSGGTTTDSKIVYKKTVGTADVLTTANTYYAPMDAGINLLAGHEFSNGVSFQLNAQLGLVKINPTVTGLASDKGNLKNTGFGVSLGYRFK